MLGYEARLHEVKKEYYQKMIQVVPASKIWKLSDAERKFHRQLFENSAANPALRNKPKK